MTIQTQPELKSLALLIGTGVVWCSGARTSRGLVTGVMEVTDAFDRRLVVEVLSRGGVRYVPYDEVREARARPNVRHRLTPRWSRALRWALPSKTPRDWAPGAGGAALRATGAVPRLVCAP
jgi:hypothetical protein